jgi:hypothetical protein
MQYQAMRTATSGIRKADEQYSSCLFALERSRATELVGAKRATFQAKRVESFISEKRRAAFD